MKKPNITPGEWHPDKTNVTVLSAKGKIIADCFQAFDVTYEQRNNVQSISAVPDMIDALVEAHKFLVVAPANMKNNRGERPINAFEKIEQALRKAGVES